MKFIGFLITAVLIAGCASVVLQPADFSWPVENALKIDSKGFVTEKRYSITLNVKPLFYEEFADSNSYDGKEIRMIRDKSGMYYITGTGFKNVYLFMPVQGGLKMEDKLAVSDSTALQSPAFNQKTSDIELVDGSNKYILNNNGIVRLK